MYKLGSHNSMTYLKPKQWYLWPFKWMAQCQSKDVKYQYSLGIRYFDIRVKYDKDGIPEFAHGILSYKADVNKTLKEMNKFGEEIQIRLILEVPKKSKDTEFQTECFRRDCKNWVKKFKNLKFHCGRRKYDWQVVYHFKNAEPEIDQKVSSMLGAKWDDIFPFIWSYLYNEEFIHNGTDKEYLLLDFVHVR